MAPKNLNIKELTKEEFANTFREMCKLHFSLDCTELTNESIEEIVGKFFEIDKLTEARNYLYDAFREVYKDKNVEKPRWELPMEELEQTAEYKVYKRESNINEALYITDNILNMEGRWVMVNGKVHTDEEAASIAADKWCDLIFGNHIQDNGALNETPSFMASVLGTLLADKVKEKLESDVREKTHNLFREYYLHKLHYDRTHDETDINWLKENLPDNSDKYHDWERFGYAIDLYCDYGPTAPLHLILVNGGIPENDTHNICPWKTGISIRHEDNTVMYRTYGKCDEM